MTKHEKEKRIVAKVSVFKLWEIFKKWKIKQQLKKSQWNKKNYLQSKLKVKLSTGKQGNNNTADETDFNSDSEDDDKDRVSS